MRRAFEVAIAFLRIPRFFISLLVVPCILSLVLIYLQLLITQKFLRTIDQSPKSVRAKILSEPRPHFLHKLAFKVDKKLPPIETCIWQLVPSSEAECSGVAACTSGVVNEAPEHPERCPLDPFDVVIQASDPSLVSLSDYQRAFDGNFLRLHVCRHCSSNIVVSVEPSGAVTHVGSVWGLGLLTLTRFSKKNVERIIEVLDQAELADKVLGKKLLYVPGLVEPVQINEFADSLGVVANFAVIIVIALWLALRAHRKVLDYFSHSGALLPLVAAVGQQTFYGGIWILTLIRVALFLLAAIPLGYLVLAESVSTKSLKSLFFGGDIFALLLWTIAIVSSFALATLIASISDLRHRHSLLSIIYKYIPLMACLLGGLVWSLSFLLAADASRIVREIIASLPLVGMVAVLMAPIFSPLLGILVLNTLLTVLLTVVIAKVNSRWFAAHLDEV